MVGSTATVEIRAVDGPDTADPIARFEIDLGNDASKALIDQDWAALARLTPAAKRSKDPAKVAGARKRTSPAAVPAEPPVH